MESQAFNLSCRYESLSCMMTSSRPHLRWCGCRMLLSPLRPELTAILASPSPTSRLPPGLCPPTPITSALGASSWLRDMATSTAAQVAAQAPATQRCWPLQHLLQDPFYLITFHSTSNSTSESNCMQSVACSKALQAASLSWQVHLRRAQWS